MKIKTTKNLTLCILTPGNTVQLLIISGKLYGSDQRRDRAINDLSSDYFRLTKNCTEMAEIKKSGKIKGELGCEEGMEYEALSLEWLMKSGHAKYGNTVDLARELKLGHDVKFDDLGVIYNKEGQAPDIILIQLKHKQGHDQINAESLLASNKANMGQMWKDFNLPKYFISYLKAKTMVETEDCHSKMAGGNLKYVIILTNTGLNTKDLKSKGISLTNVADEDLKDLKKLFFEDEKSSTSTNYHQIRTIDTNDVQKILDCTSDLHRVAQELAKYAIDTGMSPGGRLIDDYHVVLAQNVIQFPSTEQDKFRGKFKTDFIENKNLKEPDQKLREAMFEAIKELDKSIKNADKFKGILSNAKWPANNNFGNPEEEGAASTDYSTDLHEVARELAKCALYKESTVAMTPEGVFRDYHSALIAKVITKTTVVSDKPKEHVKYRGKFREDFIDKIRSADQEDQFGLALLKELEGKLKCNKDKAIENLKKAAWNMNENFGTTNEAGAAPQEVLESDLPEVACELAKYAIPKTKSTYMDTKGILNTYSVALTQKVIQKEGKSSSSVKQNVCGKFNDNFTNKKDLADAETDLRSAVFDAMRTLDPRCTSAKEAELIRILEAAQWPLSFNFGTSARTEGLKPWNSFDESDFADFLKHLVFMVNQPTVEILKSRLHSVRLSTLWKNIAKKYPEYRPIVDEIQNFAPTNKRDPRDKLGVKQQWFTPDEIEKFCATESKQDIVSFLARTLTLSYVLSIMGGDEYCPFPNSGALTGEMNQFLQDVKKKVLLVNTPNTFLSSYKVLKYLYNDVNNKERRISVGSKILKNAEKRNVVKEALKLAENNLLTLECEDATQELDDELLSMIKGTSKKIILIVKQGNRVANKITNEYKNQCSTFFDKISVGDVPIVSQNKILEKEVTFLGHKMRLNALINNENFAKLMNTKTLVKIMKNEEINIGSYNAGINDLTGAYSQLYQDINPERLIANLLKEEHIFLISGINEPKNSKSFIEKLKDFNTELEVDNIPQNQISHFDPDTEQNTRILLDDECQDKNFKQLCRTNSNQKIYWIRLKNDSDNASKFVLQQIYNPNLYVDRQFNYVDKVIIKNNVHEVLQSNHSDVFLFTGVANQKDLLALFPDNVGKKIEENIRKNPGTVVIETDNDPSHFNQLDNGDNSIHWLHVEHANGNKKITWIKSRGTLDQLRKYIGQVGRAGKIREDEFIKWVKDQQVVIIADDPGMGKTTSLTKLCTLEYGLKSKATSMFAERWIINVNLKDHISTIEEIGSSNIGIEAIIKLCSAVDSNLDSKFAQDILRYAIENSNFIKPLLIKFDGFDEVLDNNIRHKIIELIQSLCKYPNVKFWITSRRHCEQDLENALLTFATKIEPLDDQQSKKFIYKFLKDRLDLTLSENQLNSIFGDTVDKVLERPYKIAKYAEAFLNNMKVIFDGDNAKFIGTPLQLYLLLECSIERFKEWIANDNNDQDPNFEYLGDNMLSVYEKFINHKYDIYLKKEDIQEPLLRKLLKVTFDQHHQDYVESSILKSEREKSVEEYKEIYLSAGIMISHGSDIAFIHPTFREYFAAKVFMHWIEKCSDVLANTNKLEYLLTEIFMKPDYQVIRQFINLHLEKFMQIKTFEKTLQQSGKLIADLWMRRPNPLIINCDQTILYIAVAETNKHIVKFILYSAEYSEIVLEDLLTRKVSILHSVFSTNVLYITAAQKLRIRQYYGIPREVTMESRRMMNSENDPDIDVFLQITKDNENIRKKMLLATFFHQNYEDPVNNNLFSYIKRYHNNNHLTLIKKTSKYIDVVKAIVCGNDDRKLLSLNEDEGQRNAYLAAVEDLRKHKNVKFVRRLLEKLSSDVKDKDVMSALLNIQFCQSEFRPCDLFESVVVPGYVHRVKIVETLIEHGVNLHTATQYNGNSRLHQAFKSLKVIKFLVEQQKVDVHVTNKMGDNVLMLAISHNCQLDMIKYLLDIGININATNYAGETALYRVCGHNVNCVKILLERGARIDVANNNGETALHHFALQLEWDCLKLLIQQGGNIWTKDKKGSSVLDVANRMLERNIAAHKERRSDCTKEKEMLKFLTKASTKSNPNSVSLP